MKTSAIVRIVVWSVIAVLLFGLLLFGLGSGFRGCSIIPLHIGDLVEYSRSYSYADGDRYSAGGASVSMAGIREIEVHWVDGRVNVETSAGAEISFSETSSRQLEERYQLHYYVNGSKLMIQYCQPNISITGWRGLEKELTLTVPESLSLSGMRVEAVSAQVLYQGVNADTLRIEGVSGGMRIMGVQAADVKIESVSGQVVVEEVTADILKVESVSGSTKLLGCALDDVDVEAISGSIEIEPGAACSRVSVDSISGSVRLRLPENEGFRARYSSASGSFRCDFDADTEKKTAIYKDGGMDIDLNTVSGSMRIERE